MRGAGAITQLIADRGVGDALQSVTATRREGRDVGPDYEQATREMIVTEASRRLSADPGLRARAGVTHSAPAAWAGVRDLLTELDRVARNPELDPDVGSRLLDRLEDEVRRLGAGDHLDALLGRPAVHDLARPPSTRD